MVKLNLNSEFGDELETVKNSMINLLNVVLEQDENPKSSKGRDEPEV